jgi:predicted anti-sigma-YlaC factor YlaD
MPRSVAEHLRDCATCRSFVTTWNAVELRLRSLKEQWPEAAEVREVVTAPFRPVARHRPALSPVPSRAWVAIGAAAAVLVIGLALYAGFAMRTATSIAAGASGRGPLGVDAIEAIRRDPPVAATH